MKRFVVAGVFITCLAPLSSAQVSARIFDEVIMPKKILAAAEKEASFALTTGGIDVTWIDCSRGQACGAPLAANDVIIRIRMSRPDMIKGQHGEILGNAAGPRDGSGVYAWVWYDEVRRSAIGAGFSMWHNLLGCVIAHEIGHLLMGPDHHAGTLMQAHWGAHELDLISKDQLRFDAGQRIRMKARVLARSGSTPFDLAGAAAPKSFSKEM